VPNFTVADERFLVLLQEIAQNREPAMEELWSLTSGRLRRYVLKIVPDEWSAEEAVQDVYRQLWSQASTYDPDRSCPSAWLYTIARSRAFDTLRRMKRSGCQTSLEDHVGISEMGNPQQEHEANSLRQRMILALAALPPRQRQAIDLAFYEGYTHTEIAARIGVPLGTVKTRIRSALSRIGETFSPGDLPRAA
jgi:RNA polymerase sigma-70 factor (ECF subfamily)